MVVATTQFLRARSKNGGDTIRAKSFSWPAAAAGLQVFLTGLVVAASLLFGGGTRNGFLGDAVLQLCAIPLLLLSLLGLLRNGLRKSFWPVAFCCGIALIPVLQLMPLPTAQWAQLPGRNIVAETYAALGQELPSLPMSLTPLATGLSALSLLSPFAIFLGCLLLNYRQRRNIGLLIVGFAVLSVLVGFLQLAQGPNSPLRFFAFTNTTEAVGFFANRNHLAALLYAAMLLVVSWAVDAAATAKRQGKNKTDRKSVV